MKKKKKERNRNIGNCLSDFCVSNNYMQIRIKVLSMRHVGGFLSFGHLDHSDLHSSGFAQSF